MKLSIRKKENGQLILLNDNEAEKLENGVQKKYYWENHEENHRGGQEFKEKLLDFKRFEAGPKGVALEFSDKNKTGNSPAKIATNTRRGNQIGNESSANQNAIESQNNPAVEIEEVPNEVVPDVEMTE